MTASYFCFCWATVGSPNVAFPAGPTISAIVTAILIEVDVTPGAELAPQLGTVASADPSEVPLPLPSSPAAGVPVPVVAVEPDPAAPPGPAPATGAPPVEPVCEVETP